MDFDLPRDLADWQRRVRAFVAAELSPHDAAIEKTGVIPPSALDGLRRMGLYGLNTPKHYGGLGLTMLGTCLALQELAKAHIAYYYVSGVNVHIGSKGIEFDGTEAQRRRWLPELASGRIVASFALTEPGAGSDAGGIATTAVRDGGHYVLNGRKIYITNAPVAGLFTVFARTRSDNPRGAISAFLVEAGTPGLEIGEATEMLAGNGSGHAEVIFRDCRIPAANLLGEAEGRGFATAMKCLDAGRVCWGAYCVGAAERLLELAVGHVTTRKQFGVPSLPTRASNGRSPTCTRACIRRGSFLAKPRGPTTPSPSSARPGARSPSTLAPTWCSGSPTRRCRCSAARAMRNRSPWSASGARSASCASSTAPPRSCARS